MPDKIEDGLQILSTTPTFPGAVVAASADERTTPSHELEVEFVNKTGFVIPVAVNLNPGDAQTELHFIDTRRGQLILQHQTTFPSPTSR